MRVLINIFVILICSASFAVAFAQFPYPGNDSEVGVSMHGFPNYYTGNLSFVSKDLVVAGAVGKRGLSWGRRSNSRTPQAKLLFGLGHNWTHNWQWEMVDDGTDSLNRHIINVYKPSGQTYRFVETSPGIWSSSPGVKDRLIQRNNKFILEICSNPIVDQ